MYLFLIYKLSRFLYGNKLYCNTELREKLTVQSVSFFCVMPDCYSASNDSCHPRSACRLFFTEAYARPTPFAELVDEQEPEEGNGKASVGRGFRKGSSRSRTNAFVQRRPLPFRKSAAHFVPFPSFRFRLLKHAAKRLAGLPSSQNLRSTRGFPCMFDAE